MSIMQEVKCYIQILKVYSVLSYLHKHVMTESTLLFFYFFA